MNWEVLILKLADPAERSWSLDSAVRVPLGETEQVKAALASVFGEGDWSTLGKGLFDHQGCSFEAGIGIHGQVDTMTLEFWKAGDPLPSLRELCSSNGWQAWDLDLWRPVDFSGQADARKLP